MKETDAVEAEFGLREIVWCPAFGYGVVTDMGDVFATVEFDAAVYVFDKFTGLPTGVLSQYREDETFHIFHKESAPNKVIVLTVLEYGGMISTCSLCGFLLGVLW